MVKRQFRQLKNAQDTFKKDDIGLYVVWKGTDVHGSAEKVIDDWLGGFASMFVITDKLGIAMPSDFRKIMVNLETMEVISADQPNEELIDLEEMIAACEAIEG